MESLYELRKDRDVCKFGGKTARFKGEQMENWNGYDCRHLSINPYVRAERSLIIGESANLFPVTKVDDFLRGFMSHDGHILSRNGAWELFPEQVEALAVHRSSTYHTYYRQRTISFDVPIVGHIILTKEEEVKRPAVN